MKNISIFFVFLFMFTTLINAQSVKWAKIDLVGVWETDHYQYPSGLKEYRPSNLKARLEIFINLNSPLGLDAIISGPDGTKIKEGMLWINYRNELCVGKDYNYSGIGDQWDWYYDRRGVKSIKIKLEGLPGQPWAHYKKISNY